jgi:hypothetical protein
MKSPAATVEQYLASLPADRRDALSTLRRAILQHLPEGYVETMMMGGIAYVIPLARFADTYNGHPLMIAALASQKNYLTVHLMGIYGNKELRGWLIAEFKKAGKKFDAGQACIRFKTLSDIPLDAVARAAGRISPDQLIAAHNRAQSRRPHKRKPAAKSC